MYSHPYILRWNENIHFDKGKTATSTDVSVSAKSHVVQRSVYLINFLDLITYDFVPLNEAKLLSCVVSTLQVALLCV